MGENETYTAVPAFDSPEEAAIKKEEKSTVFTYSENADYDAVPAFDPPEEAEFYKKQKEKAELDKKRNSSVHHEN